MVDYVREMTAEKSCKYGEHGSREHLLFLFLVGSCCFLHYEYDMDICNESCSAGCVVWQKLDIGYYTQTIQPDLLGYLSIVIGTIGFYHFIPLSLTLT